MRITIDTGNKQIKGEKGRVFSAGIIESNTAPTFGDDVLFYRGKYYTLTDERIPYMRDKTEDNRYFILSLFAIGYQFEATDALDPEDVIDVQLLIGLPPSHYGSLREKYEEYYKSRAATDFEFNGVGYSIIITEVCSYPQAYAAVTSRLQEIRVFPKAMVIDIGGYTADLLQLKNGRPDTSVCESLEYGTIKFYNQVKMKVNADYDCKVNEADIDVVLMGNGSLLSDEIQNYIIKLARTYIQDFFNQLREMEIDLKTAYSIFVGGGSILFRPFIEEQAAKMGRWEFITDISANAEGYKILYAADRASNG